MGAIELGGVGSITDSDVIANAVDEDATSGTVVGITALATDPDGSDTVAYSLSSNPDNLFAIDANTGVVTVIGSLDAETATEPRYRCDGGPAPTARTSVQTFTIAVNDVNETAISATTDSDGSANSVSEAATVGTAVGVTALATDADVTDTVTYSLTSNPGNFFAIDATTGVVTVAGALDYETDTSHVIEVTATSSDGSTSVESFTINVTDDTSEASVGAVSDSDVTANAVDEDATSGTVVGITGVGQ